MMSKPFGDYPFELDPGQQDFAIKKWQSYRPNIVVDEAESLGERTWSSPGKDGIYSVTTGSPPIWELIDDHLPFDSK